jgi:hypothetical protein
VLVLRDVLGFRASEVAEILDTTDAAVNSVLRRSRTALDGRLPAAGRERAPLPNSRREREVVGRFADAFEAGDIDAVVALLTGDAWLRMPPQPFEYGLLVLTLAGGGIAEITWFADSSVFPHFGLPRTVPAERT